MKKYEVINNKTGQSAVWEGEQPPTQEDIAQLFAAPSSPVPLAGARQDEFTPLHQSQQAGQSPAGFSFGEMVGNIPQSAEKYVSDVTYPIRHPINTAKAMQSLLQGAIEKMLPNEINGVEFGETQNEQNLDAVGAFLKDRYGGFDKFKQTLQDDPVGVLADASSVITLGGAATAKLAGKAGKIGEAASKAQQVGRALDPVNVTISAVKKTGASIPKAVPRRLIDSAFKFNEKNTVKRARLVDYVLENSMVPTIKQLEKNLSKLDDLSRKISARIARAERSGAEIPVSALYMDMPDVRAKYGGVRIHAKKDLGIIDSVYKEIMDNLRDLGKKTITPKELQTIKTDAYKKVTFDRLSQRTEPATDAARKAIARSARKSLEEIDPALKPLNKEWGLLKQIEPHIEQSVNRFYNSDLINFGGAAKIGVGHTVLGGGVGTGVGATAAFLGKAPNKARVAIVLENLRRLSETKTAIQNSMPAAVSRAMLIEVSRAEEALRDQLPESEDGSE